MNVHNPKPDWRKTKHEQKIELIVQAYDAGHTNSVAIAEWLSEYFTYPLTGDHVRELYSRNKTKGGKLLDYPLQHASNRRYTAAFVNRAAELWNSGLDAYLVAEVMGINREKVYDVIDRNRSKFDRRHLRRDMHRNDEVKAHPDRVTRYTNGWPITLPRVTFIDGAAP